MLNPHFLKKKSPWENIRNNQHYGVFLFQFFNSTNKFIREFGMVKLNRHNMTRLFNQAFLNEVKLPKYTYIHVCVCVWLCLWCVCVLVKRVRGGQKLREKSVDKLRVTMHCVVFYVKTVFFSKYCVSSKYNKF